MAYARLWGVERASLVSGRRVSLVHFGAQRYGPVWTKHSTPATFVVGLRPRVLQVFKRMRPAEVQFQKLLQPLSCL